MSLKQTGTDIGSLCQEKNEAYGDSFARSGEILEILYPDGIKPDQYRDALGIVRVIDKLFRLATDKDAFDESPWRDIAGYGILGAFNDSNPQFEQLIRPLKSYEVVLNWEPSCQDCIYALVDVHDIPCKKCFHLSFLPHFVREED